MRLDVAVVLARRREDVLEDARRPGEDRLEILLTTAAEDSALEVGVGHDMYANRRCLGHPDRSRVDGRPLAS